MSTTSATEILKQRFGNDAKRQASVDEESRKLKMAQLIYDARNAAGLTQAQLAAMVGTRQPVIARLEDADYGQQSLRMLERIAAVLDLDVEIRLVKHDTKQEVSKLSYLPAHAAFGATTGCVR